MALLFAGSAGLFGFWLVGELFQLDIVPTVLIGFGGLSASGAVLFGLAWLLGKLADRLGAGRD
ncbi:MAG: hypothetical protein OEQ25_12910 [Gammaproteobacteria bacterium]|nr:hypothetical protein [Gammaproteobacteria bacterium]